MDETSMKLLLEHNKHQTKKKGNLATCYKLTFAVFCKDDSKLISY